MTQEAEKRPVKGMRMIKKVRFIGMSNVVKPGRSLTYPDLWTWLVGSYLPGRTGVDCPMRSSQH